MTRKIKLTLSPEKRSKKADGDEEKGIEHNLINSKNTVEITLRELGEAVVNGQSFCHCVFSGTRSDANFISSQLVVLDIDNKDISNVLTLGQALDRLKEYGLDCNMAYTSFSDSIAKGETDPEKLKMATKYRLIFMLPKLIIDYSTFNKIVRDGFYQIFPESDSVAGVQYWFGGKNLLPLNLDYELDIELFWNVVSIKGTSHYKHKNRRYEQIKQFAAIPSDIMEGIEGRNVENTANVLSNIKTHAVKHTFPPIRNFNWDWACHEFNLLNDFINCRKKIYHNELFYLYLAMQKIEGGRRKWINSVINNPEIDDNKVNEIPFFLDKRVMCNYTLHESKIYNYAPDDPAAQKYDFLTNISNKMNGKIYETQDTHYIQLDDAKGALNYWFSDIKSDLGNGKYVLKCATGLGKTEEIVRCNYLAECVIALPTHALITEVSDRFKKHGTEHYVIPEMPKLPESINVIYDTLSSIGAHGKATSFLHQIESGKNKLEYCVSDSDFNRVQNELKSYFDTVEECQDTTFPVLTTHKKIIYSKFPNHSTFIIDEDIFSSLFEIKSTSTKDLRMLIHRLKGEKYYNVDYDFVELKKFITNVNTTYQSTVTKTDILKQKLSKQFKDRLEKMIFRNDIPMMGSIIGFFDSDLFFVDSEDRKNDPEGEKRIYYLKKHQFPTDKKIIILSATADEEIYQRVFGKIDFFTELSNVQRKGKHIQVYDKGLSRNWMGKKVNKPPLELIKKLAGDRPVITFKAHKSGFENAADFSIESSEGFDGYKDKNIVVVGTPHLPVASYALWAAALGYEFSKKDLDMKYTREEHQGIQFDFLTFSHEGLRKIQFYKIESQLIQAVGRARTLQFDVSVHLFAKFPLLGFK